MLNQGFLIQKDYERKINYDWLNQLNTCSILNENFTIHVKNYERKINYE